MSLEGNDTQARQTKVSKPKNKCIDEDCTGRVGASASQSERAWGVENETGNPTGERRDSNRNIDTKPGKTFGGMLRQLIAEHNDQLAEYRSKLAEYQSKIEELEHRRSQLQEFYEQLQVNAGEDEDEELPEDEVQARREEE
jgi:TolA-binding protein